MRVKCQMARRTPAAVPLQAAPAVDPRPCVFTLPSLLPDRIGGSALRGVLENFVRRSAPLRPKFFRERLVDDDHGRDANPNESQRWEMQSKHSSRFFHILDHRIDDTEFDTPVLLTSLCALCFYART